MFTATLLAPKAYRCCRCSFPHAPHKKVQSRYISNFGLKPLTAKPVPSVSTGSEAGPSKVKEIKENVTEDFKDYVGELERRKRKVDAKRRQKGADFVDHLLVTVRGGKGGSGAAAFEGARSGALGPPSGGNGGVGGSIFIRTSPSLTSLSSLTKRAIGGQGSNGAGSWKHGRKGTDVVINVPVGTVIKELKREGEEERIRREEKDLNLDMDERITRRRERWFVKHPGGDVEDTDFLAAEEFLRKEGKFVASTPNFHDVPPIVLDIDRPIIEPLLLAQGGQGGLGNPHFHNISLSHKGPPRLASRGTLPATLTFSFELKLLADVGLVGLPNVGKSTLLRGLTGRRAEIADYSFTTLNPQIGVVRVFENGSWSGSVSGEGGLVEETWVEREADEKARKDGEYMALPRSGRSSSSSEGGGVRKHQLVERTRFTMADNPGLLPSASENYGLGHSFLRSIERSPVLVYVLDLSRPDPATDLKVLRNELEAYLPGLAEKGKLVILNKGDQVDEEAGRGRLKGVQSYVEGLPESEDLSVVVISGKFGLGLERVVEVLAGKVEEARETAKQKEKEKYGSEDDY